MISSDNPSPQPNRRERNKQIVRELIYTTSLQLMREYGYDNTSIGLIAERADIARGTFFNHFRSKDDLIVEWSDRRRVELNAMLGALPPPASWAEQLRASFVVLAEINSRDAVVTRQALAAWVKTAGPISESPDGARIIGRIVAGGVEAGEFRAGLDTDFVGHALRDLYLGVLYRRLDRLADLPGLRAELLDALDLVLPALLPEDQDRDEGGGS